MTIHWDLVLSIWSAVASLGIAVGGIFAVLVLLYIPIAWVVTRIKERRG